jgi:hypothetical protein
MKNSLLAGLLVLTLGACRKGENDLAQPEYADWYALRAPDARPIEAVYGNIDSTLVITTRYRIYQTTDRGKTWQAGDYSAMYGLTGFAARADTLLAFTASTSTSFDTTTYVSYAVSPSYASLDKGITWRGYHSPSRRPGLEPRVALNRLKAASGTEYSIAYRLMPTAPNSGSNYIETVGIKTSTGRRFALPNSHQIQSIYFDSQSRLYVAASAKLCGQGKDFAFCGEQNGVLYVSKRPQL